MQALILVGGHGTRLRPITSTMPKPIIPLVDRPFLGYMIDWLAQHGVDDIVMACGFRPDDIRAVLGDGAHGGPRLRYVEEPEPRGTAGAMRFARDAGLLEDVFLALNGDVLCDLDLSALIELHREREARATLALYPVEDPSSYGLVRRAPDGEIREFLEKPEPAEIDTDEISAGAYVLQREVLDLVPPDRDVSIEREVFPRLVGDGLYSRRLEGYWMDIGTPGRYLEACWDILARRVRTEPGERVDGEGRYIDSEATVDPAAVIGGESFIGAGAKVGARARLGPRVVLGPGAEVGEGASVSGSALHPAVRIGAGAEVRGAILAAGAEVAPGARVPEGAVVGAGAQIGADAELEPGARVQPEELVA